METPHLLIVSDEPEFGRLLTGRWQTEPRVPALTQVSSDLWNPANASGYDLVILGPLARHRVSGILESFGPAGVAALCVVENEREAAEVGCRNPDCVALLRQNDWVRMVVLLAVQMLQSIAAQRRAENAEKTARVLQRRAALGRYMLEMRHGLNNALTSLLGNSDLLLIEPGSLSAQARAQIETIRNMTLRIHEVMQRFSSLEKEMNVVAQQVERDSGKYRVAAAAGD